MGVSEDFSAFCGNLVIDNVSDISRRYKVITQRLNTDFWGSSSDLLHSLHVGSYGRDTAIVQAHDMDMVFELPSSLYKKYNEYSGNGQSALLQSVRASLQKTYPSTSIRGDGQVVVVRFSDEMRFEIVPVFISTTGTYIYPDTNDGGTWKTTDPKAEMSEINRLNVVYNKNLKRLCRMARAWRRHCDVKISGILIDTLAVIFMKNWEHGEKSYLYYDYMSRDFMKFLSSCDVTQEYWLAPGSNQRIWRTGNFERKALDSYNICLDAIKKYVSELPISARSRFREVYGNYFPS